MDHDTAFEISPANLRFGPGITAEVGTDLADAGLRHIAVVIDPALRELPPVTNVLASLDSEHLTYALFDGVRSEPTDASFREAIAWAAANPCDGFVAIGGGSAIDTAKAANLYATHPADFFDYVNSPVGKGLSVPGPLKPLIAIPTTAGTGSETTGVAIFDHAERQVKTGISHRHLKPTLGLVDPDNTRSLPPAVAASTGIDVLCHAIESYTAIPCDQRLKPQRGSQRPPYLGANPASDLWALEALRMAAEHIVRAVSDPSDDTARSRMLLASAYAGLGFGRAGVHLPHAMAYPVAGMVRNFQPAGYAADHAMVPHGMAVVLNAPAAFRFTSAACPDRHLRAAEILGANTTGAAPADAGKILADRLIELMAKLGMPNGLQAVGYHRDDIPALVAGTLAQQRLTQLSPRPAGEGDLVAMFEDAMRYW